MSARAAATARSGPSGREQVGLPRADRHDLDAPPLQGRGRVRPDVAGRAGDEDAGHGAWSGQVRSRSDIVRPPAGGAGHSIPNAGSSQRTPRAASGTYGVDMT